MHDLVSYLDPILKVFEIIIIPGIYLFYKEIKEISEHLSNMKIEISRLAPMDRFVELSNKVSVVETRLQITLERIESDLEEIKGKIS